MYYQSIYMKLKEQDSTITVKECDFEHVIGMNGEMTNIVRLVRLKCGILEVQVEELPVGVMADMAMPCCAS